jgi:hypothetical protein
MSWSEKTEKAFELAGKVPQEIHALVMMGTGILLCLVGHKDIGEPLLTGGALIWKKN